MKEDGKYKVEGSVGLGKSQKKVDMAMNADSDPQLQVME